VLDIAMKNEFSSWIPWVFTSNPTKLARGSPEISDQPSLLFTFGHTNLEQECICKFKSK